MAILVYEADPPHKNHQHAYGNAKFGCRLATADYSERNEDRSCRATHVESGSSSLYAARILNRCSLVGLFLSSISCALCGICGTFGRLTRSHRFFGLLSF
jgi:hypothetical protein